MKYTMTLFRTTIATCSLILLIIISACSDDSGSDNGPDPGEVNLAEKNLLRAMEITDNAITSYFTGDGMAMARYYNPYTSIRSDEKGSVWMYTSAIEAVNAILRGLEAHKEHGNAALYNEHFDKYSQ